MGNSPQFNPAVAERNAKLSAIGSNPGQAYEVQVKTLKDTLFYNPASSVTGAQIFVSSGKDPQWQDGYFPMPSYARILKQIAVQTNLQFNGTANTNGYLYQNFMNNSYISFTVQKNEVYKVWLWQCVSFAISPDIVSLPAATPVTRQDMFLRFNDIKPNVQIGAGNDCIIKFVPYSGLTTATAGVGTPVVTNYGNTGLTSSSGYYVQFFLNVDEWQSAS